MSKWVIDKEFGFDYGHRVWSQELNTEFATEDQKPVCRHLHGHRCKLNIFLEGDNLERGMVTDFHHLNWFKPFIDDNVDHKFILDRSDPWFNGIINGKLTRSDKVVERGKSDEWPVPGRDKTMPMHITTTETLMISTDPLEPRHLELIPIYVPNTKHLAGHALNTTILEGPEQEFYEGFFIMNFLPTSENLCKWVYDCVAIKMARIDVKVQRVEWAETPKSRAMYTG